MRLTTLRLARSLSRDRACQQQEKPAAPWAWSPGGNNVSTTLLIFGIILPWLIVVLTAALGCWISFQLIHQNGRMLSRLETLEQRLGQLAAAAPAVPSPPPAPIAAPAPAAGPPPGLREG